MDLVLRGVVIGMFSVIAIFAFLCFLSWHEEEMRHTVAKIITFCERKAQ